MQNRSKKAFDYLVFTPAEERVVGFLKLKKKKASISEISKSLQLARTSIYHALSSLMRKKIVQKEKFEYFLVSNNLIQSDAYDAKKKIDDLLVEMLRLRKGDIIYSIESDEEIAYLLEIEKGLPKWQKAVADRGIVLKGIGSIKALALFRNMQTGELGKEIKRRSGAARFMAETLSGPCVLVSFRSSVVFFSRKNGYFYRIDDGNIARFMQAIIETLYLNLHYKPLFVE